MKVFLVIAALALTASFSGTNASAALITDLVGDKDGSFLGAPFADGQLWRDALGGVFFTDYRGAADLAEAPHTDFWSNASPVSPASWTHSFLLTGTAVSAVLQLNIAGFAELAPIGFFGDGVLLSTFSFPGQFQTTHVLSIVVPLALIADGSVTFNLRPLSDSRDGYIIDFSELKIVTEVAAIPEPHSLYLLGGGLLAGLAVRHLRR